MNSSSLTVDSRGAKSRSCALSTEVEASLKTIVARSPLDGVAVVKGMWTWAKCGPLASFCDPGSMELFPVWPE